MLAERVKTWVEEWKQEGLRQGIEEGLQQGWEEGRLEGEANVLQRQLTRRFGELSGETIQKIHQASADELILWTDNIFDAKSLDDVFGEQ